MSNSKYNPRLEPDNPVIRRLHMTECMHIRGVRIHNRIHHDTPYGACSIHKVGLCHDCFFQNFYVLKPTHQICEEITK